MISLVIFAGGRGHKTNTAAENAQLKVTMWGSCLELGLLCVLDEVVAALSGFGAVEVADTANLAGAEHRLGDSISLASSRSSRAHSLRLSLFLFCCIPYSVESTERTHSLRHPGLVIDHLL